MSNLDEVIDGSLAPEEQALLTRNGHHLDTQLTDKEASVDGYGYYPCKTNTLRVWRCKGIACGVAAPRYEKTGRMVRHTPRLAFEWRRQHTRILGHTGEAA